MTCLPFQHWKLVVERESRDLLFQCRRLVAERESRDMLFQCRRLVAERESRDMLFQCRRLVAERESRGLIVCVLYGPGPFCFTATEARLLIRDGDRGGGGEGAGKRARE